MLTCTSSQVSSLWRITYHRLASLQVRFSTDLLVGHMVGREGGLSLFVLGLLMLG